MPRCFLAANSHRALIIAVMLVATATLTAQARAAPPNVPTNITIEPQSLATALQAFSEQSGLQVGFESQLAKGIQTQGTKGLQTPAQALTTLLKGTGLEYHFINDQTVVVREKAPRQSSREPMNSQGTRLAEEGTRLGTPPPEAGNEDSSSAKGTEQNKRPLEEIVVTGTLIRGITPASPTITLTRGDIEKGGFSTVQELMASIPQNYSTSATDQGFTSTGDTAALGNKTAGASINLRGLGGDSTLVLLDGHRLAPTFAGHFVDVSMIPLSAVERVEVVPDGASALYGSDAVGGVVNFIMRKDYDGAESQVRYGTSTEGGASDVEASQLLGVNWTTGNALLSYEYYDRGALTSTEREFSAGATSPNYLLPQQERNSAFFSARQELGDSVTLYGEALYSKRNAHIVVSRNVAPVAGETQSTSNQINVSPGVTVKLPADWLLDMAGLYSRNGDDENQLNTVASGVRNPVTISEAYKMWSIDPKVDGPLFSLPGGVVRLALGGSYRSEAVSQVQNNANTVRDGLSRDEYAAFGEMQIPLVSARNQIPGVARLEATAAVRYEHYNDFGSTTNPKAGLVYSPGAGLNIRGTYSTSFKAPYLEELVTAGNSATLFNEPDAAAPGGKILALFLNGGNARLQPENSTSWTAGFDFTPPPMPALKLQTTYFNVHYRDRVSALGTAAPTAITSLTSSGNLAPFVTLNPAAALVSSLLAQSPTFFNDFGPFSPGDIKAIADNRYVNAPVTDTSGIDLSVAYTHEVGADTVAATLDGTYLIDLRQSIVPTAPAVQLVSTFGNPVDFRMRASLGWSRTRFSVTAFLNYMDSYTDNVSVPHKEISSWTTMDLAAALNLPHDLRFALNVQNLFDAHPPYVSNSLLTGPSGIARGYDPANASPIGRSISVALKKQW